MQSHRLSLVLLAMGAGCLAAWFLVATFVVPPLIESAYRGESLPALNAIIEGRDVHPLSAYLESWDRVRRIVLVTTAALFALALLITRREFQRAVDALGGESDAIAAGERARASVSGIRRGLVGASVLLLVGSHLVVIGVARESWPISHYDMYATIRDADDFERHNLFGVVGERELELDAGFHLAPFDIPRLHRAMLLLKLVQGDEAMERALAACLVLYERRRLDGDHDGPPLDGIRYYRLDWEVDPWARNRDQPSHRELIAEHRADG